MISPETALHISVADFLRRALPPEIQWTTFPAGGGGKERGRILQAMGFKPGWPDIQFLDAAGRYYGIELKTPKGPRSAAGRLTDEQKDLHPKLMATGAAVAVCRSLEDVEETLRAWGFPLKASVMPFGRRAAA